MSVLTAYAIAALLHRTPALDRVTTSQAPSRFEYWLYPPGVPATGPQKWGVIASTSAADAQQELQRRQDSQRKWWNWVGAKDSVTDDPYSYMNFTGPVTVRPDGVRVPAGISTANVWIASIEEIEVRRRLAADLSEMRLKLEAAKDVLDALLPIGTNTRIAADLRGRTIYYAPQLVDTMAKVREVEAILQASQGYTLADAMFEVDELKVRVMRLDTQLPPRPEVTTVVAATPPAPALFAKPTTGGSAPTSTPAPTAPATGGGTTLTPTTPTNNEGATTLLPAGTPTAPATSGQTTGPQTLIPGGGSAPATKGPDTTGPAIEQLNRRLAAYATTKTGDPTLSATIFDRDGFTIRRQVVVNGVPQFPTPERVAYTSIPDPNRLFLAQSDPITIFYGNPDLTQGDLKPILPLPSGTTAEAATDLVKLLKRVVVRLGGGNFTIEEPVAAPTAPTEQEANERIDAAVAAIKSPQPVTENDLLGVAIPEWLRAELLLRSAGAPDEMTLATQYSARLAEGGEVLDESGKAVTLEALAKTVTGQEWRTGPADRAAWTVTSYNDNAGTVDIILQASYVGHSAANSIDRAVHGAKIQETWIVTPEGASLKKVRVLRAGTVYRVVPPKASDFSDRHLAEGVRLLAENRPQAALTPLEAALRISPERAELWSQYGAALYRVGQNFESLGSYRLARDLDPKNPTIVTNYVTVLRSMGDFPTAIAAGRQAIELDPESIPARESLALALFATKDYKGAAEQYAEAVKRSPTDGRLRANYSSALLRAGQKKEALTEAQQAYAAGFKDHWVFAELGIKG